MSRRILVRCRTLLRIGLAVVTILLPVCAATVPAQASNELRVSRDGTHWRHSLNRPLFDPHRRWVPGDRDQATFWVRNATESAADLTLTVSLRGDQALRSDDVLTVTARVGESRWHPLPRHGAGHRRRITLPAGTTRIRVRATFAAAAPNNTQDRHSRVAIHVRLTERHAASDTTHRTHRSTNGGWLAPTGAPPLIVLGLLVGGVAVGTGLALILHRRSDGPPDRSQTMPRGGAGP